MKQFLSKNQLLLLKLFYTNPEKSFYMQEIGRILQKKPGVFQRTLNALTETGLLSSEHRAHARYFKANTSHSLYPELKKIIAKTIGAEGTLRKFFARLKEVKAALLYGSFAKGKEHLNSDIDVLIVGNPSVENRLVREIPKLEKGLQREINYKLYSETEYRLKKSKNDPFLQEILTDRKIVLKGNPDVI